MADKFAEDEANVLKSKAFLNLTSNILAMAASILLSLWLVPFMINNVGSEGYSFIPLTQQMINYMTVISVALTSMSGRFFTIAKTTDRIEDARGYFNTSLVTAFFCSLIVGFFILVSSFYINQLINIPSNLIFDVQTSFIIYGVVFLLGMITSSFSIAPFANNKLYLTSIVNIINVVARTFLIMFLLLALTPRIWYVSLGALLAAIISLIASIYFFKKIEPDIKIDFRRFDKSKFKELMGSGMWNSVGQIGTILFIQIDILVANWYLGPIVSGEYSAVLQWSVLIRAFSANITSIFTPTIIALYAGKKIKELASYANKAVSLTGLIMALPIGIISGMGGSLLGLWINPDFAKYQGLLTILTLHLAVNLSVQTLFSVQIATNKVKTPAIVSMIMGIANFILAIVLAHYLNMGAIGIALSGFIVLTTKNLFFTPIYAAHITNMPWYTYTIGVIRPIVCTLGVWGIAYACQSVFQINSLVMFVTIAVAIAAIYVGVVYAILLSKDEKQLFRGLLNRFGKKV